ncbi:glycosyltransferase [Micromonospora sp. URMC 103]|uniref:glycosyltransferase n=1 Tax=Micromonospora sp. URMC 103 TaxID=3423406 RepID=UPI003F1DE131
MTQSRVLVDAAGGSGGGAGRLKVELDAFLAGRSLPVTVIGRDRQLTPSWLLRRELPAQRTPVAVATNNASFAWKGTHRRVLVHNALHFLRPAEEHLLAALPRTLRAQIPVVRGLLRRADFVGVPCAAMAERVRELVPSVRDRVQVRANPVSPVGPRLPTERVSILVPVVPSPFKNVVSELRVLLAALDLLGGPADVLMTVYRRELPDEVAHHPRLRTLGRLPHHDLAAYWRTASAVFFPCVLESFGYPLAEARVYGLPVLAPDTDQAREIAAGALTPYRLGDVSSLAAALERIGEPIVPEPDAFERNGYFRWLLGLPDRVVGPPAAGERDAAAAR